MISYIPKTQMLGARPRSLPCGTAGGLMAPYTAPESEWASRKGIGRQLIKNHAGPKRKKQQFNDCTCNMITNLVESARSQSGLSYVELSATAVYNHINGGRDWGSNLHSAADYITKVGCVPVSMWPASTWRMSEPSGYGEMASKYQAISWIDIPNAAAVITAVGWYARAVGIGVNWGGGGHAITVVDYNTRDSVPQDHLAAYEEFVSYLSQKDPQEGKLCKTALDGDQYWFEIENSWGDSWGENGFGWLPFSQVDAGVRNRYGGVCLTLVTHTK